MGIENYCVQRKRWESEGKEMEKEIVLNRENEWDLCVLKPVGIYILYISL